MHDMCNIVFYLLIIELKIEQIWWDMRTMPVYRYMFGLLYTCCEETVYKSDLIGNLNGLFNYRYTCMFSERTASADLLCCFFIRDLK